ncbi:hypothetical protein GCM10023238_37720 [Streptomyces heliomycini]
MRIPDHVVTQALMADSVRAPVSTLTSWPARTSDDPGWEIKDRAATHGMLTRCSTPATCGTESDQP